jgi:hypothetical protein
MQDHLAPANRSGGALRLPIGWREYVDVPEWRIRGILAKIDTGARTSAIDVADIEELGQSRVRFHVVMSRQHRDRRVAIEARVKRRTCVRSSLGHVEPRLIIEATLRIGPVLKRVELGLVCRKRLRCRMLLGRTALDSDFLVDSGRTCLLSRRKSVEKSPRKKKRSATSPDGKVERS